MAASSPSAMQQAVRVGTDCSGMETAVAALRALKVEHEHQWSCDWDEEAKKTICANFAPKAWFDNCLSRRDLELPDVDLYISGFPRLAFSDTEEELQGDPAGIFRDRRGRVFFGCCGVIEKKRPKAFILELVKSAIAHAGGQTMLACMGLLRSIGDDGSRAWACGAYDLSWQLLDECRHGGVPFRRQRVYLVGIRKDAARNQVQFSWPGALPCPQSEQFLDPVRQGEGIMTLLQQLNAPISTVRDALSELAATGVEVFEQALIVKCAPSEWWVTHRGRHLREDEMMRLRGMDDKSFVQVISNEELAEQVENAISQSILERILVRLLPAVGLVPPDCLRDRWEAAAAPAIAAAAAAAAAAAEELRKAAAAARYAAAAAAAASAEEPSLQTASDGVEEAPTLTAAGTRKRKKASEEAAERPAPAPTVQPQDTTASVEVEEAPPVLPATGKLKRKGPAQRLLDS
ncbi:unnamed protein product [Polarella glacialis]|uniref:DNA (cytosine-5-)-methyltransferase n=1 Tax=Polarella glacialis TaxID=89957 RepID=A0A813DUQ9_POLGL|nr:unnamed protein product [Polarella glacialis]